MSRESSGENVLESISDEDEKPSSRESFHQINSESIDHLDLDKEAKDLITMQLQHIRDIEKDNEKKGAIINELHEHVDDLMKVKDENSQLKKSLFLLEKQVSNKHEELSKVTNTYLALQKEKLETDGILDELVKDKEESRKKIHQTNEKLQDLLDEFNEAERTKEELESTVHALRVEISRTNKVNRRKEQDVENALEVAREDSENEIVKIQNLVKKYEIENDDLRDRIAENEKNDETKQRERDLFINNLFAKVVNVQHKVFGMNLELGRLQYLKTGDSEKDGGLEEMINKAVSDWEKFTEVNEDLVTQNDDLRATIDTLRKDNEENSKLLGGVDDINEKILEENELVKEENKRLSRDVEIMREEFDKSAQDKLMENIDLKNRILELQKQAQIDKQNSRSLEGESEEKISELVEKIQTLEMEKTESFQKLNREMGVIQKDNLQRKTEIEVTKEENVALATQNKELNFKVNKLEQEIESLRKMSDAKSDEIVVENQKLKEELERVKEQGNHQITQYVEENAKLKKEIGDLGVKNDEFAKNVKKMRQREEEMLEESEGMNQQEKELKDQVKQWKDDHDNLRKKLENLINREKELSDEITKYREENRDLSQKAETLIEKEQELSNMKTELENSNELCQKLQEKIDILENETKELTTTITSKDQLAENLEMKNLDMTKENDLLKVENDRISETIGKLTENTTDLDTKYQEAAAKWSQFAKLYTTAKSECEELENERETLQTQVDGLNDENKRFVNDSKVIEENLAQMNESLTKVLNDVAITKKESRIEAIDFLSLSDESVLFRINNTVLGETREKLLELFSDVYEKISDENRRKVETREKDVEVDALREQLEQSSGLMEVQKNVIKDLKEKLDDTQSKKEILGRELENTRNLLSGLYKQFDREEPFEQIREEGEGEGEGEGENESEGESVKGANEEEGEIDWDEFRNDFSNRIIDLLVEQKEIIDENMNLRNGIEEEKRKKLEVLEKLKEQANEGEKTKTEMDGLHEKLKHEMLETESELQKQLKEKEMLFEEEKKEHLIVKQKHGELLESITKARDNFENLSRLFAFVIRGFRPMNSKIQELFSHTRLLNNYIETMKNNQNFLVREIGKLYNDFKVKDELASLSIAMLSLDKLMKKLSKFVEEEQTVFRDIKLLDPSEVANIEESLPLLFSYVKTEQSEFDVEVFNRVVQILDPKFNVSFSGIEDFISKVDNVDVSEFVTEFRALFQQIVKKYNDEVVERMTAEKKCKEEKKRIKTIKKALASLKKKNKEHEDIITLLKKERRRRPSPDRELEIQRLLRNKKSLKTRIDLLETEIRGMNREKNIKKQEENLMKDTLRNSRFEVDKLTRKLNTQKKKIRFLEKDNERKQVEIRELEIFKRNNLLLDRGNGALFKPKRKKKRYDDIPRMSYSPPSAEKAKREDVEIFKEEETIFEEKKPLEKKRKRKKKKQSFSVYDEKEYSLMDDLESSHALVNKLATAKKRVNQEMKFLGKELNHARKSMMNLKENVVLASPHKKKSKRRKRKFFPNGNIKL